MCMTKRCPSCGSILLYQNEEDGIIKFRCSNKNCNKPIWYLYHGWLTQVKTNTLCTYLDKRIRLRLKDNETLCGFVDNYESEYDSDDGGEDIFLIVDDGRTLYFTDYRIESIELLDDNNENDD